MIYNKCAPEDPYAQSYETLVGKLKDFYAPAPLEIAENFRFHQRRQQEGESILQYVATLQKLSITCNFGPFLKTALRNQFVFGIKSTRIQSRLLEMKNLTFDKAVELATSMEMSAKDTDQLQNTVAPVQAVDTRKPQRSQPPRHNQKKTFEWKHTHNNTKTNTVNTSPKSIHCFRCGRGHLATQCTLNRNIKCSVCGIRGHLRSVCFKNKSSTHLIEEILFTKSSKNILQIEHAEHRSKFITELQVNGKNIQFEVDSGAAVTVANKEQMFKLFPNSTIHSTDLRLITYCKNALHTEGYIIVQVK